MASPEDTHGSETGPDRPSEPGRTRRDDPVTPSAPNDSASDASRQTQRPSQEAIASRAYEIYQQRGGSDGNDVEDWLRAERELIDPSAERDLLIRDRLHKAAD